jgi:hypothetical protein
MDVNGDWNYNGNEPFGEYALNPVSVTAGSDTPGINIELIGGTGINKPPEGEEGAGCSCKTISPAGSESLETEQMIGFLLPFTMVFLTIVFLIRGRKKAY